MVGAPASTDGRCLRANPILSSREPAAQLSEAPASARSLQNPFSNRPGDAAAGHKLFEQHCAPSHGPDAHGLEHAADLHSAAVQDAPPGVLF